ncbi:MAG: BamA/TamA family outer membrane protein [Cyclobacteriaceae bacterium]|nr:BamA/TamA family outer membrane protein [Cyclobacteriaceae bacterium]
MGRFVFLIIIGSFTYFTSFSQTLNRIVWEGTKDLSNIQIPSICLSDSCKMELATLKNELHQKGFLEASYEYKEVSDSLCVVRFYQGPAYTLGVLNYSEVPADIRKLLKKQLIKGEVFNQNKMENAFNECLEMNKKNGYIHAAVYLDSVQFSHSVISGNVVFEEGLQMITDSLFIRFEDRAPSPWLRGYIGWKKGMPYTSTLKNQFLQRLYRTGYYSAPTIDRESVYGNHVSVDIGLKDRMSDRFEGIIGYAGKENQRYFIGQTDIFLSNLFSSGVETEIYWQKLKPLSSRMDAQIKWLGAFGFPLEIDVGINLLKEDTLFFNKSSHILATLLKGSNTYLSFSGEFNKGSLLYEMQLNPLPESQPGDFSINYFGFQIGNKIFSEKTDRIKREWNLSFSLGNKIYEDFNQPTNDLIQWKGIGSAENHFDLKNNWKISTGINIGIVESKYLFYNDLFMMGGLNTFRGFNENQFFTSQYFLSNLELRYQFISGGYFLYFIDGGFLKSSEGLNSYFAALGTGPGMVMPVKQGVFQLIFAVGTRQSEKISLRDSKIHFGYVVKF